MENNGQILYIGTTLINSGTSLHAVEDAIGHENFKFPIYLDHRKTFNVLLQGRTLSITSTVHNPVWSTNVGRDGLIPLLETKGAVLKHVTVGEAPALLVDAAKMKSILWKNTLYGALPCIRHGVHEQNLLITGAGGGIAKAVLPVLHDLGHSMLLTTRSRTAALESFLKDENMPIFQADLTVESDVDALFEWVAKNGGLDVLVNNAGIAHAAAVTSWTLQRWSVLSNQFSSAVRCSSKALPLLRAQGTGRIINVSSVVAHKPSFGTSGYAASKSALEGYARGIAIDVANKGITANTIAYGYMEAGMLYDVPEAMLEQIKTTIPKGSFGDAS